MKKTELPKISASARLIVILICVTVNFAGNYFSELLSLPILIDSIGTCIAAYYLGTAGTVITAICGVILGGITETGTLLAAAVTAVLLSYLVKHGSYDSFTKAFRTGYWTGLVSAIAAIPVNMLCNGGRCGNLWGDTFFSMLEWKGFPTLLCSLCGHLIVFIIDRQISVVFALLIIRLIFRTGIASPPKNRNTVTGLVLAAVISTGILLQPVLTVSAENDTNYISTVYNNSNGLSASEANTVAETDDGYIWIGSYAGLTRFNGSSFEFITEGGITSVTAMLTDSKGRLWIGTNDSGFAIYENGSFTGYSTADGLAADSVRCFAEAADGTVYIGTTDKICKMNNGIISVIEADVTYALTMNCFEDGIAGATNTGSLFYIKNDNSVLTAECLTDGVYYTCTDVYSGKLYAGTSADFIEEISISDNRINCIGTISTESLYGIRRMNSDSKGRIWLSCDNGFGYIGDNRKITDMNDSDFNNSIEFIHEDYQGNIWIASSRYGVMKLSDNTFSDLFSEAGVSNTVVNTVTLYKNAFYCGADNGLIIIDRNTKKAISNELTEMLEGTRIRCIAADSENRLWICTYSEHGLICYDGTITKYNTSNGATANRFRCIAELSDGTIAAGTSDGLNFIQNGKIVSTLTNSDGMETPQILSIAEGEDGTVYAGSDGSGIYIIRDRKITGQIGAAEGLPSQVVMRITPYDGGFILVCGNSLCYMKDGIVTPLKNFPYYNNYDAVIIGERICILSSAGIYVTNVADLVSGEKISYRLYCYDDGLADGLTANSWNYLDDDGTLYFSTNRSVVYFNPDSHNKTYSEYKFGLCSVKGDGREIPFVDNVYIIPEDTKLVTIEASVRNYLPSNLKIRFFVKELNDNPATVSQNELESLQIPNLEHGEYTAYIQILNDDETAVLQESSYILRREAHAWEKKSYMIYLISAILWIGFSSLWVIVTSRAQAKHEKEIEKLKYQAKSEFLSNMSHEFRTPVNTILGMNELIRQNNPDEKTAEYSENIRHASTRLLNLINDVLDFSDIESGRLEINPTAYKLENIVNETAAFINNSESGTNTVEMIVEENMPAKLMGDYVRITQIISNLVSNAVKYTENGRITVSIGGSRYNENKMFELKITVADTGKGISGENIERIFSSFDRAGTNQSIEGTGLGLAITQKLTEAMNGTIEVRSVPESGSVFIVTIPQEISGAEIFGEQTVAEEKDKAAPVKCIHIEGARVLAVDDNEMNLNVLKGLLHKNGITPDTASGGDECLALVRENKYDLILMDHMMPSPDGIECLHIIRNEKDGLNSATPIAVLTANAVAGARKKYLEEGFDEYLSKPIDTTMLEEVLLKYVPKEFISVTYSGSDNTVSDTFGGFECADIDTGIGLRYCGGDEVFYNEVLTSYCKEGRKYQTLLGEYLETKNWKNYSITSHALSSTSLNIGAVELSKIAKKHELAANAENEAGITETFDELQELLSRVLDGAEAMISRKNETDIAVVSERKYISMLGDLLECVRNYEMSEAVSCIEKLRASRTEGSLSEQAADTISKVEKSVDDFDYSEAEKHLESFLSSHKDDKE